MVDNERGFEGDADRSGGSTANDDPADLLADADAEDADAVVERLRESGPRQHVSDESVDDVLSDLDGGENADEQDADARDADSETSEGLVGGGPTTTVSQDGIDEVFERLEAETPNHDDRVEASEDDASAVNGTDDDAVTADDPIDVQSGDSTTDDEFGTLSGGGPTTTVSDEGVDEVL